MRRIIALIFLAMSCSPKETTETSETTSKDSTVQAIDSTAIQNVTSAPAPVPEGPAIDEFNVDITYPLDPETFVLVTDRIIHVFSRSNRPQTYQPVDSVEGPFTAKYLEQESPDEVRDCEAYIWHKVEYINDHGATKKGWVGAYGTGVYHLAALKDTTYNITGLGKVRLGYMEGFPVTFSAGDGADCTMDSRMFFFYDSTQMHLIKPNFTVESFEDDKVPANSFYNYLHLEVSDPEGVRVVQEGQKTKLVYVGIDERRAIELTWDGKQLNSGDVIDVSTPEE